jgi:hypothetical protein
MHEREPPRLSEQLGGLIMDLSLEERIRQRAYFLSMSRAGDDTTFWLIAEREVMAEVATEPAPASPKATPAPVVKSIETACAAAIVHVSKYRQLFAS